jgi:hypothetical protein
MLPSISASFVSGSFSPAVTTSWPASFFPVASPLVQFEKSKAYELFRTLVLEHRLFELFIELGSGKTFEIRNA